MNEKYRGMRNDSLLFEVGWGYNWMRVIRRYADE